ncbi:MAG: hypothetical protein WCQ41_10635 [Bacillota bacterium]
MLANIYMNEFDRYVKYGLKVRCYLRYGDDFVFASSTRSLLEKQKQLATKFLQEKLKLEINTTNNIIIEAHQGIHFLGVQIYPRGRRLSKRNWQRLKSRLKIENISSYRGLLAKHDCKKLREFDWVAKNYLP